MNKENKVVKIKDVVINQIPEFILSDNPNFSEFLKQYYTSQEYQGAPIDLAENLIKYKNFDSLDNENLYSDTELTSDVNFFDDEIFVSSVKGFPNEYGLLKINDEIITYTGITTNSFTGCVRGFSGIDSLSQDGNPEYLNFSSTESNTHSKGSLVINLSSLFIKEFFKKIKYQFIPGFEEINFDSRINVPNFISKARSFYDTKGTDEAYKILFKVLYGEDVKVIKPYEYTFTPSDDEWVVCKSFICKLISGDPIKLKGQTLYQNESSDGTITSASGSIYSIDRFYLKNEVYYKMNIFTGYSINLNSSGSISGTFSQTPRTYIVEPSSTGSDIITVDSTTGFKSSGKLLINDIEVSYSDKTSNQFLNCSGITNEIEEKTEAFSENYVYGYEYDTQSEVRLRIIESFSGIDFSNNSYIVEDDSFKIDNLGNLENNNFTKSLIYNLPLTVYSGVLTQSLKNSDLEGIGLSNGNVKTIYDHNLKNGDIVNLYRTNFNQKIKSDVLVSTSSLTPKQYNINVSGISSYVGSKITAKRKLFKSKSSRYSEINNKFTANIQNSYTDKNYNYITSNGFPSFEVNPYKREFSFNLNQLNYKDLQGNHNFYDGELVTVSDYTISGKYSNPVGIDTGISFYVKKIDANNIQLCYSAENVGISSAIVFNELVNPPVNNSVSGFVSSFILVDNKIYKNKFTSSKLFKKIPKTPIESLRRNQTNPGSIGVLVNGVEIENYKSFDKIYYGKIKSINVLNSGSNYDLTNPPQFSIDGGNDIQTKLIPQMSGKITELIVSDSGFNYVDTPIVTIFGGGNDSVKTEVKMKLESRELEFNSSSTSGNVSDILDTFIFKTKHYLKTGDEIIYQTLGGSPIGIGSSSTEYLINNEKYYVINVGAGTSFRISYTKLDSFLNNYIPIREYGSGTQRFISTSKKLVVDSVNLIDVNTEFKYKKFGISASEINYYNSTVEIENHGFNQNDEIRYSFIGTNIPSLSLQTNYYVDKIDENRFRLKESKSSTTYIKFGIPDPLSTFYFEYSPIRINIEGTLSIDDQNSVIGRPASITPIILGSIKEVKVSPYGKSGYGSNSILNFQNSPTIKELVGSDANLDVLISKGKIIKVIIKNPGKDYYNSVKLEVFGSGYGANLIPVIVDGKITAVNIINGGVGYGSNTSIKISSVGKGLKVSANLESFQINDVQKLGLSNVTQGCIFGKKYSSVGNVFGIFYLNNDFLDEFKIPSLSINQNPIKHSPIIGWAYDGCPIYGPDAYLNPDGTGGLKRMQSGYRLKTNTSGFFVDDYEYVDNIGTLDEHNGRFCVTPEFPNGIYAYFCTISNNRSPIYPYFIGDSYKFLPQSENFDLNFNQNLNFNDLNIVKHTLPYGVENKENYYHYFDFNEKSQYGEVVVKNTSEGEIDDVIVLRSGVDYSINDNVIFDNSNTGGFGVIAKVSELSGVGISSIYTKSDNISNISFVNEDEKIIGISTVVFDIKDQSFVRISGISTSDFNDLEGVFKINSKNSKTTLSKSIQDQSTTGRVYSIQVNNSILNYKVDYLLKIDSEILKVIGIDLNNNLLNVLREIGSPSHSIGSTVTTLQTTFEVDYKLPKKLPFKNESYYFNPSQSVSVGISTSVGAGNTLTIPPLGYGVSLTEFIPTGRIFLPNHKFKHGEKIIYEPGENSIVVSGIGNLSSISELYVVKIDNNTIGLTNSKKLINDTRNLLLYVSAENNYLHKLKTDRTVVTGNLLLNRTLVSTAQTHGLVVGDQVHLNILSGITTTYTVSYDNSTARLKINSQNNPRIEVYENQKLVFDTSSNSLSNSLFKLYTDSNFTNEYFGTYESGIEVIKSSSDLTLKITEHTPRVLFYNIESSTDKVYSDESVNNYNTINIKPIPFNNVTSGITTFSQYSFELNYPFDSTNDLYDKNNSSLSYSVVSSNIKGPIKKIKIISRGKGYKKLPKISSVSGKGYGCDLIPVGKSIGKILSTSVVNNEFTLPTDKTLKPFSYGYSSLFVYDNYKVKSLDIIEKGSNYLSAPKINLYSIQNNSLISDFSADATIKNGSIDDIKLINSSSGLLSTDDKIVFTKNNNGLRILGISTASILNGTAVTLTLETPISGFTTSNPLPFLINDKVFVEGISSLETGYNSSDNNYEFFNLIGIQTSYNSQNSAQITYFVNKSLTSPVIEITIKNNAYVVNSNILPKIKATLTQNEFFTKENVGDSEIISNIKNNPITNLIKIKEPSTISLGNLLTGSISGAKAKVFEIEKYDLDFKSSTSSIQKFGWKGQRGNLSSNTQKLSDNNYYQNFSYSLKSKKQINDWDSIVSNISHVSGYKKFSDLVIESKISGISSIKTDDSSKINISLNSYVDTNTINDFDLVLENVDEYDNLASDTIKFNSKVLSDYLLSKENTVLPIDDISNLFDTDIPNNVVISVDQFSEEVVLKYIFFVQSTTSFFGEFEIPQFFELFLTRDNEILNLTSYSYFDNNNLGKIAAEINEDNSVSVNYIPSNAFNSLSIRAFKESANSQVGIASTSYGYTTNVAITTSYSSEISPSQKIIYRVPIVEVASGTVFVGISSISNKIQSSMEMAFLYNPQKLEYNVYSTNELVNLGTVGISTSGNDLIITYNGISGIGVTVYSNLTLLTNNLSSPNTIINNNLTRLNSSIISGTYSSGSNQYLTTFSKNYGASKFGIEVTKTVGITTQKSFIFLDSIHYLEETYLNNINYSTFGNFEDLVFETIYDEPSNSYILSYIPSETADYSIKFFEKNILSSQT